MVNYWKRFVSGHHALSIINTLILLLCVRACVTDVTSRAREGCVIISGTLTAACIGTL